MPEWKSHHIVGVFVFGEDEPTTQACVCPLALRSAVRLWTFSAWRHQAAPGRHGDGFRTGGNVELGVEPAQVGRDGALADGQPVGDRRVRLSFGQQRQDVGPLEERGEPGKFVLSSNQGVAGTGICGFSSAFRAMAASRRADAAGDWLPV